MSFIDMMASDIWSDTDITNRTEAMVRAVVPLHEELILNRKLEAVRRGEYTLLDEDKALALTLANVSTAAQKAGAEARADMAALHKVLAVEKAMSRLEQPPVTPELDADGAVLNQAQVDEDDADRVAAQAVIDAADKATRDLVELRRPPAPPIDPPIDPSIDPLQPAATESREST